ncbi:transposase [Neobacillus drentensis]
MFFNWIQDLKRLKNLDSTIVGMEPTGHYWINLSKWLDKQNIEVVTVNPHLVKRNKENRDNTQSKSDKKDALVIADMVKNGYYSFVRPTSESFEKAGLHLAEASSGKWKGQIVISKRGRSRLRRFLYLATMSLVMNNHEFKALDSHNVKVKKLKKMKSIMKLIGKLARIFVGIARRNESYCPNKVQVLIPLAA